MVFFRRSYIFAVDLCYVVGTNSGRMLDHTGRTFGNGHPWAFDSIYPNHLHHVSYVAFDVLTKTMGNRILEECCNMQKILEVTLIISSQ